jgi:hypothetical protein
MRRVLLFGRTLLFMFRRCPGTGRENIKNPTKCYKITIADWAFMD